MSASGRYCCKTPKMPCDQFLANGANEPQSPVDVASKAVTEVACEFIANYVVPQTIVRSPRVRPAKFVLLGAKRLLQQYRLFSDVSPSLSNVRSWGSKEHVLQARLFSFSAQRGLGEPGQPAAPRRAAVSSYAYLSRLGCPANQCLQRSNGHPDVLPSRP
jgi:hypothetical protein